MLPGALFVVADMFDRDIVEVEYFLRCYLNELLDKNTVTALNELLRVDLTTKDLARRLVDLYKERVARSPTLQLVEEDTSVRGFAILLETIPNDVQRAIYARDPSDACCTVLLCDADGNAPMQVSKLESGSYWDIEKA